VVGVQAAELLFDAERALREAATELQLRGPQAGRDAMRVAREAIKSMSNFLLKHCGGGGAPASLCDTVRMAKEVAVELAERWSSPAELRRLDRALDDVEREVARLTGSRCRFRAVAEGAWAPSPASLLNDLAACVHRLAEWAAGLRPAAREGRCVVVEGASADAVEACREWDRAARHFFLRGKVHAVDEPALAGWVVGRRVYLRVGSSVGHRAELDLAERRLRYYDVDLDVAEELGRLLEAYSGSRCRVSEEGARGGAAPALECELGDPLRAARALAAATSMDIRMETFASSYVERVVEECAERVAREEGLL
jgi:hypothetical protein